MFLSLWSLLYIILVLQGILCVIPHFPHQRVRQFVMKLFTKISHIKYIKTALIVYAIILFVLLYQSISTQMFNRKMKNQEDAPIIKMNYLIGMYRAQRNTYLCGFSLFLELVMALSIRFFTDFTAKQREYHQIKKDEKEPQKPAEEKNAREKKED